jgi:hypothetical protein
MPILLYILGKVATILIVAFLAWYVKKHPNSVQGRIARKLFATTSPKPALKETEHDFFMRYSLWAFKWFFQLALIWVAGVYIVGASGDSPVIVQAVFYFMLPMLGVMALVGSMLLYSRAFVSKFRNKQKIFSESANDFVIDNRKINF